MNLRKTVLLIAVAVPLVVVLIATLVYFRYGRSVQYDEYLVQARNARAEAVNIQDVAAQREAWQRVLFYLDKAEEYGSSNDTRSLRGEVKVVGDPVPSESGAVGAQDVEVRVGVGGGANGDLRRPCCICRISQMPPNTRSTQKNIR